MTGEFWQTWGDGAAEVAAYTLTMPNTGHLRRGTCLAITSVEPFSKSLRVKADEGRHGKADIAQVMKLNVLREYQTGVSSSRDMLSVFTWLESFGSVIDGMAAKVSYSSQEWCGQVWSQLVWSPEAVLQTAHSYFDGEADRRRSIPAPQDSISEDSLFLAARRIGWPRLRLGQTYPVSVLTSLETERVRRMPLIWSKVELSLGKDRQTVVVPAGRYRTNPFRARWADGAFRHFDVEADPPHRLVRWTTSTGEEATLTGVMRMKHWQMNREGNEKALEALGIRPVTSLRL